MNFDELRVRYRFPIKWLTIAFLLKGSMFAFFALQFCQNYPPDSIEFSLFISSGDTGGYYQPIEAFVNGAGYTSICRMPGLLPIYGPLYFLFGTLGKVPVIFLQFILGVISTYLLAISAKNIFGSLQVFYFTFFLYGLSSFVSIWDHYGYSDSFSTSFLIISFYFFTRFVNSKRAAMLLASGFFMAWSVFLRPVNLIVIPCYFVLLLINCKGNIRSLIKNALRVVAPCLILIACWGFYTYRVHGKPILLQAPFSECYGNVLSPDHLAIRALIIALGGDFQEWSQGSRSQWFFSNKINYKQSNPFTKYNFTSQYNFDSILNLRNKYHFLHDKNDLSEEEKKLLEADLVTTANRYHASYKSENTFRYYILNRLILVRKFIFPGRLDNLPFPKFADMSLYHKLIKFGYLILLNFISFGGICGLILGFFKKNYYGIIPLTFILLFTCILGFIEQRYLVPAYPFLCIYCSWFIAFLHSKWRNRSIAG
jgi:hypothetical protein